MPTRIVPPAVGVAAILSTFALAAGPDTSPSPSLADLRASSSVVRPGESVLLTWEGDPTLTSVYVSGVGLVDRNGMRTVRLRESTAYTLVAESPLGVRTDTVTIRVDGGRGSSQFPQEDDPRFSFPVTSKVQTLPYTQLLARIENVLQDDLKFSVRPLPIPGSGMRFITTLSLRSELVRPEETKIGGRRLAYRVDVEPAAGTNALRYTIHTLVEFRRKLEQTWRVDEDENIHRQSADVLRRRVAP